FASLEVFQRYLASADMAVQLRTHSRGETSAAALDCMNFALPLIVNANGSMAELDPRAVWLLPDEFDERSLIEALETLWQEPQRRRTLGEHAREIIRSRHSPRECARRYANAIDAFHRRAQTATPALTRAIANQNQFVPNDAELRSVSNAIAVTLPLKSPAKRLFLDISATRRNDLKTGIERVARALLLALLQDAPAGYRVEPVYLSDAHGRWHYRFARRYALGLLGVPTGALDDEIAEPECGDELLALDLSGETLVQAARAGLFADYRNRGCAIHAVVFDLLPVRMPHVFPPGADEAHARWLSAVSGFDGALCISKAVADDLAAWHAETGLDRKEGRPFRIGWFPLGADLANTSPSRGVSGDCEWVLRQLLLRPSFLMVGTVEPRKGYLQTIDAFSRLWADGIDVNLVIVGTEGWKGLPDEMRRDIPRTIECLRSHPERQRRVFWLEGISDDYLEKVYAASTCLIAASFGEGFGLPLIEAAQHGLPIIARDIPVFREVAREHAFYF
ncbi:MAG: glycosyltransferase, partial [Bradyrhizobium sp.]